MRFLFIAAAVLALAVAKPTKRDFVQPGPGGPAPIIDIDQGIAIGPAIIPPPDNVVIGPAIVPNPDNIAVGPALIDFPLPDGGALTEVNPVMPSPVGPSPNAPLVQIILNIRSPSDVAVDTVHSPQPSPVQIVDQPIIPEPVIIVDKPIIPEPVIVVEKPEAPEAVIIADPIIPVPVITLPDIIN